MNQESSAEKDSGTRGRGSRPDLGWIVITWGRVIVGLALVGEGGVLYAHARTQAGGPSWWIGVVAVVLGAALSLSGIYAIYARSRPEEVIVPDSIPSRPEPAVPMLGALLVYKFQVITELELERALEQQRKEGKNRRRIGEILLDMGLISGAQLRKALEHQREQAGRTQRAEGEGEAESAGERAEASKVGGESQES